MSKRKKEKTGKISIDDMRKLINRNAGLDVAHSLKENNPTEVREWIPTGSRVLDSIICRGKIAGIPVGKIVELAGLEGVGKSYFGVQIATNAQKMGVDVVYFDSESAIDPSFLEKAGINLEKFLYIQATSVEFVLETIEQLLETDNKFLFIWDSLALTPSISDVEGDFNPLSSMAIKPRILSKGMSKIIVPLANSQSTLLVLNQLKTKIPSNQADRIDAMINPWFTPGGKAMHYAYSLRIWLTGRKSKTSYIEDDKGYRIGSEVKAKIEKSRFGTAGRHCNFKILWAGGEVRVEEMEAFLDYFKESQYCEVRGPRYYYKNSSDEETNFFGKDFEKMYNTDIYFKELVNKAIEEEVILNFENQVGNSEKYYKEDEEPED